MTTDNFRFYLQKDSSKQVKQEVNGTVMLPPIVFPGLSLAGLFSLVKLLLAIASNFYLAEDAWLVTNVLAYSSGASTIKHFGFWTFSIKLTPLKIKF